MIASHKDNSLMVLAILLALTLVSWLMLYSVGLDYKSAGVLLLCFAFVKGQLIMSQFMELNKAVLPVRIAFWLWTVAVCGISVGMFLR